MYKDKEKRAKRQQCRYYSSQIEQKIYETVADLLRELNQRIDRRLVATFFRLLLVLIIHRHRNESLWLSELGGYLVPENAKAGEKRIQKLLYSRKWDSLVLEEYLWQQGDRKVEAGEKRAETLLAIWDESVVEKSESLKLEGLGPVRSMKARRLKRIKPGYFNPPGGPPVFVPGFHWLQVLVTGMKGPVVLAHAHFWTTRGPRASQGREEERLVLWKSAQHWKTSVIHVFDRGFAGNPWLTLLFIHALRFILRWPKDYRLMDQQGVEKKAWQIGRGKRSWEHRLLWDARRQCWRKVGIVAFPVIERVHGQPLWLVISRQGPGKLPWYLLTNELADTPQRAWNIILAYARRWQIEMSLRFEKSELGLESLRVFSWEVRQRLLFILMLVHAFCLHLLSPPLLHLRTYLLNQWFHHTGERSRVSPTPLVRLRFALSLLWSYFPPPFLTRLN